jgi:peptide/nickel transport system substrate-binding protein
MTALAPAASAICRSFALVTALVALAACTKVGTGPGGDTRHAYTIPHEFRFAAGEDIQGLDPLTHSSGVETYLAGLTMGFLIRTDARGNATVPELITEIPSQANGGISRDGKTITWHIRKGVKWSDGVPFDGDDVVFSTQQVLNPANDVVSRDGWDLIDKIDEPDKYTVIYHLKKGYSSFAVTFFSTGSANPCLLPKHLLKGLPNLNNVPFNSKPIGIGPFKYEVWKRADSVVMVPNPLYFRGVPKLQRVTFKIIPDRNTVLQEIQTHDLDLWITVPPHFVPRLKTIPGIKLLMTPSYFFDHLDFNLSHPVLQDPAVRQALRYATNRPYLDQKIDNDLYILTESPITPASIYDAKLPLVPFDLAKANAILDAAGWKRGPDGVRVKNGQRLSLTFASSLGSPDSDIKIELIRGWWKSIGVDFTVKRYLASQLFAPAPEGGIMYGGKFDVVSFAWGSDPNEDMSNLYACYRFPPDGQNDPRWCNEKATAAMDAAKVLYGYDKRAPYETFVQQAVYKDIPTVILDARREIYAVNDDVRNYNPNPVAPFDNFLDVDI